MLTRKRLTTALGVIALAITFLHGFFWPGGDADQSANVTKQTRVNQPIVLHLPGKPKRGYEWRINAERSQGLDLVTLDPMGWSFESERRGSENFTKPGVLRYAVRPKKVGRAVLILEYFRPESAASASAERRIEINILPAS